MHESVFRKASLDRLASPEQLDHLLKVVGPRAWLALASLVGLIGLAAVWAFLGEITSKVSGEGILVGGGGRISVVSGVSGHVERIWVRNGQHVAKGATLVTVVPAGSLGDPDSAAAAPAATQDGTVMEVLVSPGSLVQPGTALLSVELDGRMAGREAVLYLPATEEGVLPGMPVRLVSSQWKAADGSSVGGRVTWVSASPSSFLGMMRVFENEMVVNDLIGRGLVREVRVEVDSALDDGAGPYCRGDVIVRRSRPVDLLLPSLTRR